MKLITAEIQKQLDAAPRENNKAIFKLFNAFGSGTWIIFEQEKDAPDVLWGLCDLGMGCCEFGTVSLSELTALRKFGAPMVERDRHFTNAGKPMQFFRDYYDTHGTLNGV